MDDDLLLILKALSDASRLRIVGLLAARPMAVEELADGLGLTPGTIVHHLNRLRDAGLVEARPRHPYMEYRLLVGRLHEIGKRLDSAAQPGAFDAKVLRAFFVDGQLTSIPAQEKKRQVILRYLAETVFVPNVAYPEKEVNQRLAVHHPDVASLRRYLIEWHYMRREAGVYELRPRTEWPSA